MSENNFSSAGIPALNFQMFGLRAKHAQLQRDVASLVAQKERLEREIVLGFAPVLALGLKGEQIVASLCSGMVVGSNGPVDVLTLEGVKISVKISRAHPPYKDAKMRRYVWGKVFGYRDKYCSDPPYDVLVLIGLKGACKIDDDESPFVFFVVPREQVAYVATKGGHMGSSIQISTDLKKARSARTRRLKEFRVSAAKLGEVVRSSKPSLAATGS